MIIDDLETRFVPTVPDDTTDPPRFAQPVETTKDVFVLELRKFFNRAYQTSNVLEEMPTIRKFDVSFNPNETSLETAVKLIQKLPGIDENLPLIAVLGATGRNVPMGICGQYVSSINDPPFVLGSNTEPFALTDQQTIIFKSVDDRGVTHNSTIILRASRFVNIAAATANEVASEINKQALYAHACDNGTGKVKLIFGGPATFETRGEIEIIGGTAISALGFVIGQKKSYQEIIPYNRYHQSTALDVAIEVVAEDYNVRTELNDIVWSFFTVFLDKRDYIFLGRSIFDNNIPNETYQIIIKPDLAMSGENEVPRPNDEKDKLYVNRINVSVTTIQYIDRAVVKPGTTTPLYLTKDNVEYDEGIPQKN